MLKAFWLRWTLNCAAGEILGIAIAAGLAGLVLMTLGEPQSWPTRIGFLLLMLGAGALEGYAVGWFQWRVLRERFTVPKADWIGATVSVAVLGWLLGMLPSTLASNPESGAVAFEPSLGQIALFALLFGLGAGVLFGIGQWVVLRHYAEGAGVWVMANALGWGLALVWIYPIASSMPVGIALWQQVLLGALAGLLSGVSIGGITGWFLLRIQPKLGQAQRA